MSKVNLRPITGVISGMIEVPGDKSISHRAVMFSSIAKGTTTITNFLDGEDCLHTIDSFRSLGVSIEVSGTTVTVTSNGPESLQEAKKPLYFGNSGTTARLMIGLLAGLPLLTMIYGDPFLTERPMDRVINPLKQMGANIVGRKQDTLLPLAIKGQQLTGIHYTLPVKSAQVKSAVLLAGLFAEGKTTVIEETKTRDHTENMLEAFGADIEVNGNEVSISNKGTLEARNIHVPGDISSAAFLMVAAAIVPGSELTLKNVGLNETRSGIIDVLVNMGANIKISGEKTLAGEKSGDITISHKQLLGTTIDGDIIPRLIDELPIIALLATQAEGTTIIKDAEELRVKETDRIEAVVDVLSTLGAQVQSTEDGMIIKGRTALSGGEISSYHDHRIAMMGAIASLIAKDEVILDDDASIAVSYPNFFEDLQRIIM
ncbi:MAG TPA: 3-phosphoshikimate 1-carboxyvinyltransferase [Candidatus Dormibacteraeota bacterium]|nr:3-phosphoshikimate 1-carboxyvinyltransferase [Candidatus Dormibacteraeota bacterium]